MTLHLGGTLGQGIFFLFIIFFLKPHFFTYWLMVFILEISQVGQVSPCFKKVGTSDYRERTFFHIKAQLFITSINIAATQLSQNSTRESILSICRLSEEDGRKSLCHSFRILHFTLLLHTLNALSKSSFPRSWNSFCCALSRFCRTFSLLVH